MDKYKNPLYMSTTYIMIKENEETPLHKCNICDILINKIYYIFSAFSGPTRICITCIEKYYNVETIYNNRLKITLKDVEMDIE